jgi:uncharacterized protein YndB with AHSA1/START domain
MSHVHIVRVYPHAPAKVWRALTDPELIGQWGMRSEGFSTAIGTRFKFFGTPNRAWRGFIECQMLEVEAPARLRYSWVDNPGSNITYVTWTLEPLALRGASRDEPLEGTRLTFEHSGFEGVGGFLLATFIMGPGHRKKLFQELPRLLARLADREPKR